MSVRLAGTHPDVRAAAEFAVRIADFYGVPVTVTSGLRTFDEQRRLYKRFLSGRARFPAAPPGGSAHEFGMAFDSVVSRADLPLWNAIREYVGFRTLPSDIVHAVVPNWRSFV